MSNKVSSTNGLNLVATVSQEAKEATILALLVKIGNSSNNNSILLFCDFINYGIGSVTSLDEMQLLHDKMLLSIKTSEMAQGAKSVAREALCNNRRAWLGYCYLRANYVDEFNKVEAVNNAQPSKWRKVIAAKQAALLTGAPTAKALATSAADLGKQVDHMKREASQDRAAIIETLIALLDDKTANLAKYKTTINSLVTKLKTGREALPMYTPTASVVPMEQAIAS